MKRNTILAIGLLLPLAAQAEIYKCVGEYGRPIFSQQPCAADAQVVELKEGNSGVNLGAQGDWSKTLDANRGRDIERRIAGHEDNIRSLMRTRDNRLSELKQKKNRAANNRAGAEWEQSISQEMQAVSEDYNARIQFERDTIRDLRSQQSNNPE